MLRFRCPACREAEVELSAIGESGWTCSSCGTAWSRRSGVLDGLPPEARARFARFFADARKIREAEGRRADDSSYYLDLPFHAGGTAWNGSWPQRAAAWRYFESKILAPLEAAADRPLAVLDAGAGVGWLSYRLALRGHHPVAVDLIDDPADGLGAAGRYYEKLKTPFPAIQAEMDNLPLADDQFDLVVYSASFHYAADYRQTLQEARRVLGWGGRVAILDTPIFQHFQQGERMVEDRQAWSERAYGTRADSVLSMEYLDEGMLRSLQRDLNVRWSIHRPWYGLGRQLAPLLARLQRKPPPANHWLLVGDWAGG